ncbi:MAG: hypothetical protein AAFQ02_04430 [Bacteroidota bacterium]
MPISNSASLFSLVKSLTKADKRNFKLYAKRIQSDDDMMFLKLFDVLDRMKEMDEDEIVTRLRLTDKGQLSNLKRHLYKQVLTSLRMISTSRIKSIEIREHIDYAHVLYAKGLYRQSLKILQRAKKLASKEELDLLQLEIIEFQKRIESRHITNTGPIKNEALTKEAEEVAKVVQQSVNMSNLSVLLHGFYIKNSHVKSEKEKLEFKTSFESRLSNVNLSNMGYGERIYFFQCRVWYHYVLLDFDACYEYALKWIGVFEDSPELKMLDTDLYMRGYHYLLTAAFNAQKRDLLVQHLNELQAFRKTNYAKFNETSKIFSFIYVHWARLNIHFLDGSYIEGVDIIPRTLRRIKRYKNRMATHRVMVFYYKIAWMHLGAGDPGKTVSYVSMIINDDKEDFREDIQSYSRLLYLMAHYDLDNLELLPYLVRMVDAFFKKIKTSNRLQERSIRFFKKVHTVPITERHEVIVEFAQDLKEIRKDPFEKRAYLYLDIYNWAQAKISKLSQLPGMISRDAVSHES